MSFLVVGLTMAFGTPASATTLTFPEPAPTPVIEAESEGSTTLHGIVDITCEKSTAAGKVESHGAGVTTKGAVSSLIFASCGPNNDVTVKKAGSLEIHPTGGGNGTVTSTGAEISIQVTSLGITCVFTTNSTHIGTLTGSTSANATLHIDSASIPRTGGSIFCGGSGEWTGSYKVTSPEWLEVDEGGVLTGPGRGDGTPAIKAESDGPTTLHGVLGFHDVTCQSSSLEGKVESHGTGITTKGKITSFSFADCTNDVSVKNPGTLEIHPTGGGNGTVTSSGAEIVIQLTELGISCVYTTNNTHIGTLTGSATTHATLHIDEASIPRTGGSVYCGASGEWTGSYEVTTPPWLYLDNDGRFTFPGKEPPETTPTVRAESEGATTLHGIADITCQKSTLESKVESHGTGVTAKGNISSLTFLECGNNHVVVKKAGVLEIHSNGGGNGTVTSTGAEVSIQVTAFGTTCVFTTNSTHIGTLTGSTTANATLHIDDAAIPRTGGSVFCGASGEWTGSYKVTSPTWLAVDS